MSKKWIYIYQYVLETIRLIIEAYNQKVQNKIDMDIPKLPDNLFGEDAKSFKGMIVFSEKVIWTITMMVIRPIKEDRIPNIDINYFFRERYDKDARVGGESEVVKGRLSIIVDIEKETIKFITGTVDQYYGNLKNSYPIGEEVYKDSIRDIMTILFEYQIVKSLNY